KRSLPLGAVKYQALFITCLESRATTVDVRSTIGRVACTLAPKSIEGGIGGVLPDIGGNLISISPKENSFSSGALASASSISACVRTPSGFLNVVPCGNKSEMLPYFD